MPWDDIVLAKWLPDLVVLVLKEMNLSLFSVGVLRDLIINIRSHGNQYMVTSKSFFYYYKSYRYKKS